MSSADAQVTVNPAAFEEELPRASGPHARPVGNKRHVIRH